MDSFGYWIFLLVLYLLSALMKKKKQKAAFRKLDNEEEDWETPKFVKELFPNFGKEMFSDLVEPEDVNEGSVPSFITAEVDDNVEVEERQDYVSEIPLKRTHLARVDLSSIDDHVEIGTIKHKELRKGKLKKAFFKTQHDLKMAVVYKEILDKPRSLRRRIR